MTEREVRRLAVLSRVAEEPWRLGEAGERRGVSYRPAQRRWKRYRAEGPPGLVPRSAGRASRRAKPRARRRGGEAALTQFGRRCRQWGIDIVAASSPPAQGRVERNQGTHQDRLVKKLRRQGISTQAEVNRYLEEYCPEPNARYAVAAAAPADYHLPGPGARRLREIFRLETERVLSHDWVVRHANRFYQGERPRQHHAPAKSRVRGCAWEDGRMEIHYRGQKLKWKEIGGRAEGRKAEDSGPRAGATVARRKWRPGPDHPWRRAYGGQRVAPPPWGRPPRGTLPSLASASAAP